MPIQSRIPKKGKSKEFWESDLYGDKPDFPESKPFQMPDIGEIQRRAIVPVERAYKRGVEGIQSRMSKRGMGTSGAYVDAELQGFEEYMRKIGAQGGDLGLKAAALQLEASKVGMTAEQFREQLAWEKQRFRRELSSDERRWLREQEHKEETTERGFELEAEKLNMTKEQFDTRLAWEKEEFGRTLTSQDRQFDLQMELNWKQLGLSEQEINDKKQMFYDQMKQNESQFSREYSLKETMALDQAKQEWAKIDLTEEEMTNTMYRFDKELKWQKEELGLTLSWKETEQANELAFRFEQLAQEGTLAWADHDRLIQQFQETMRAKHGWTDENGVYHPGELDKQQEWQSQQNDLDRALEEGWISNEEYALQTDRLKYEAEYGWYDENGEFQPGLRQQENAMLHDKIFGYWDEGYGPENFEGDKYTTITLSDGSTVVVATPEWQLYKAEHYHMGDLDLEEWDIKINALFSTRGISNEWGRPSEERENEKRETR